MFNKRTIKWLTVLSLSSMCYANLYPTTAQAVSKTPIFNSDNVLLEPSEPIEMPEDYPSELQEWYDSNMDARSYVVIDQATNKILANREGNVPYPIASMTKVLSMYLIYQALDEGTLKLDQEIEIPTQIVEDISSNEELSNVWLVEGFAYPVEDLMYAVMLQSANDATSALMWEIYGSEQAAVQAMQDQLTEWGITNAQIYSTSGAPNSEVPESWWMPGSNEMSENTMSAADMALVAQHTIEEYPQILDITSTREYTYMEGTDEEQILFNPNQLLEGGTYGRSGITGLKSGFTDAAGLNFVATGNQADRDFITVAMGTFGEGMSSYWEIEILLDGLLDHPEVVDLDLPTNLKAQEPAEELVEGAAQEDSATEDSTPIENNRDNAITNFMRDIFGVFN
ncbi:D-alanyl-D-alanine carboxypeptidase [Aerococcaceae bacterium INB8]|uniref:D-alanyl-D-alanine carboxypeptidase n=1 Tax=Ruoffia halotolerans TaxID=2748684 RepID=A0A839A741_9LACT|nr:serine hydrolase [Ruoffia halotolerans]MBA5730069.1 D-alanyl-D-alanine carboxypeptidase [Ruoffia halotolerans]